MGEFEHMPLSHLYSLINKAKNKSNQVSYKLEKWRDIHASVGGVGGVLA